MTSEKPTNIFCAIFGHNFKYIAKIDDNSSKFECKCCGNHFIATNNGNIESDSISDSADTLSNYFRQRRTAKLNVLLELE